MYITITERKHVRAARTGGSVQGCGRRAVKRRAGGGVRKSGDIPEDNAKRNRFNKYGPRERGH